MLVKNFNELRVILQQINAITEDTKTVDVTVADSLNGMTYLSVASLPNMVLSSQIESQVSLLRGTTFTVDLTTGSILNMVLPEVTAEAPASEQPKEKTTRSRGCASFDHLQY